MLSRTVGILIHLHFTIHIPSHHSEVTFLRFLKNTPFARWVLYD